MCAAVPLHDYSVQHSLVAAYGRWSNIQAVLVSLPMAMLFVAGAYVPSSGFLFQEIENYTFIKHCFWKFYELLT
jgi:hypothetical protein